MNEAFSPIVCPVGAIAGGLLVLSFASLHVLCEELAELQQVVGGHQPHLPHLVPRLDNKTNFSLQSLC